jgi:hypothetical protein
MDVKQHSGLEVIEESRAHVEEKNSLRCMSKDFDILPLHSLALGIYAGLYLLHALTSIYMAVLHSISLTHTPVISLFTCE